MAAVPSLPDKAPTDQPTTRREVCHCGDSLEQHAGPNHRGPCLICMAGHAPWDQCGRFTFWRVEEVND